MKLINKSSKSVSYLLEQINKFWPGDKCTTVIRGTNCTPDATAKLGGAHQSLAEM